MIILKSRYLVSFLIKDLENSLKPGYNFESNSKTLLKMWTMKGDDFLTT